MAVTKRQAEQALRQVREQFKVFIDGDYAPKLIKDWDYLESGPTKWAIVWEGGPYYWALVAKNGGGLDVGEIPPAKHWPKGTFAEPVTGWAIGIYEV
jgi:hypothetical protein